MRKIAVLLILCFQVFNAQKLDFNLLLKDKISIRAIQIVDGKVFYVGTDSKLGYVHLKDTIRKKQVRLSKEKLEFRTLAHYDQLLYTANIESPAYFYKIDKRDLSYEIFYKDTLRTAFYDAFSYDKNGRGIAISDPTKKNKAYFRTFTKKNYNQDDGIIPLYNEGEAHFAASNTNIATVGNTVWIATGGKTSRIFKFTWDKPFHWDVFSTPFVNGASSTGIYSIDFYNEKLGIAVGGDYTKQKENINNIAVTSDGGENWQSVASGKNSGYKTCVKYRPDSGGKEIIAVGDGDISYSNDFGKTWKVISEEKNLYVVEWIDKNTLVFAGKNRILKAEFSN